MKNLNIKKCAYDKCKHEGKKIDTARAVTDPEHYYFRSVTHNYYMHLDCFGKYEKELVKSATPLQGKDENK